MNHYKFGNMICSRREQMNLSQAQPAEKLNVSDKAVSKWENGRAMPRMNILAQLAALFNVSMDELLMIEDKPSPEITRIVITGGPCAGKTTGMAWIDEAFTRLGYRVLFVPESATELIGRGISPETCRNAYEFQRALLKLQKEKEEIFLQAARNMDCEKVLIVCDRGLMDSKAYMEEGQFFRIGRSMGLDLTQMRWIRCGVSSEHCRQGAEEFYTCENNASRTETVQQAREVDDALIAAWSGHPHLRVIENRGSFEDKIRRLIAEISSFPGEPEPLETERKFLIYRPDPKMLEKMDAAQKVSILQTYLKPRNQTDLPGTERRVRQRGQDGSYIFTLTEKRPFRTGQRVEIELMDLDQPVNIPEWIRVIKEVTDDPFYSNASLALKSGSGFPDEEII